MVIFYSFTRGYNWGTTGSTLLIITRKAIRCDGSWDLTWLRLDASVLADDEGLSVDVRTCPTKKKTPDFQRS